MEMIHLRPFTLIKLPVYTALSLLSLLLIPVTVVNAQAVANNNPAFLQVYVNNIENLTGPITEPPGCGAEYLDLIEYIKTQDYVPDLFIVQQISDKNQADFYADLLQVELDPKNLSDPDDYKYGYVIAEKVPKVMNSPCGSAKEFQTNAIFYRTARLQYEDPYGDATEPELTWQTQKYVTSSCVLNGQSRTISAANSFRDIKSGKKVAVGTMHWATKKHSGTIINKGLSSICNIMEINSKMESLNSDLIIFGGDTNDEEDNGDWYKQANGALTNPVNYGYTDPIYELCDDDPDLEECLGENLTTSSRRIDFLFVKQQNKDTVVTNQHTISFEEADQAAVATTGTTSVEYSDHRAIRTRVYYDNPIVFKAPYPINKPSVKTNEAYSSDSLSFNVTNHNPDPDDTLTYSKVSGPAWLTIDEQNGNLTGTPGCSDIGRNIFRVKVEKQSSSSNDNDDEADMVITVSDAGQPTSFYCPRTVYLSEVLYNAKGGDANREWVELYNNASNAIDLSAYSLGSGGSDYTNSIVQLSGIIGAGQTFVVGGSASSDFNSNPFYQQIFDFSPNFQNSGTEADGVALFNVPAQGIKIETVPIDAVIYGSNNSSELIDETGVYNNPDVGDAPSGASIERIDLVGSWQIQLNPTPNKASLSPPGNQAPVVSAGADQSVQLPSSATLSGSVTDDHFPGNPLTITWTQVSGPAGGSTTFADPASPITTATFDVIGEYTLRLTANDLEFAPWDDTKIMVNATPGPGSLILSEVLYDATGPDGGREWVELYNGTSAAIDLSGYSLGSGGSDYTTSIVQLSGIIQAGETFVVGGPTSSGANSHPVYQQIFNFNPNFQNSVSDDEYVYGDGVALFDVLASEINANTVPIDAVIYGPNNSNGLIDETGVANAPDVGDASSGNSVERIDLVGSWQIQNSPTPNTVHSGLLN